MADVRASSGVPIAAYFAGFGTPTVCAPLVVDATTGFVYSQKSNGDVFLAGAGGTLTEVNWGDIGGTLSDQTDLQSALNAKQATLVSGTNIKTINSASILGSGDLVVSGGATATTVEKNLSATPASRGKFTITDAAIGATSKVMCWQAPGPYTGKGTRADEAEMQPVNVIAVSPSAGSAVVMWETPPMVAMQQQLNDGRLTATGATFDRLMNQRTPAIFTATRINRVRGNVKFNYMVLS